MNQPQTLAERIAQAKANPMKPTIAEVKVDDLVEEGISVPLKAFLVPWGNSPKLARQDRDQTLVDCMPTAMQFSEVAFKSRTEDNFGEFTEGSSIEIMGYDLECDATGTPIVETIGEGDDAVEAFVLKDKDEDGNPLEPKVLMIWRPQWGTDYSRREGNVSGKNMLNLVPIRGVPRKERTADLEGNEQKFKTQPVDWSLIPGLQTAIERVMLNLADNPDMKSWIATIPKASNAPSTQQAQGSVAKGTGSKISTGTGQAFQSSPNPFVKAPEAKTEETKTEETKAEETQSEGGDTAEKTPRGKRQATPETSEEEITQ